VAAIKPDVESNHLRNPAAIQCLSEGLRPRPLGRHSMAALYGLVETSKEAANPYIEAALDDESPLVRETAERIHGESEPPGSDN